MYFCEADIKQLGVRNSAHRARIVSSLVAFRDKYEQHGNAERAVTAVITICICVYLSILFCSHTQNWAFVLNVDRVIVCIRYLVRFRNKYIRSLSYVKRSV